MKTTRTNIAKEKRKRTSLKKNMKLPNYKAKKDPVRRSKKELLIEQTVRNLSGQGSSINELKIKKFTKVKRALSEELQSVSKHKKTKLIKKKLTKKWKIDDLSSQHCSSTETNSMDFSSEANDSIGKPQLSTHLKDTKHQSMLEKQENALPIIIEMLSKNILMIDILDTLKCHSVTKSEKDISCNTTTFESNSHSKNTAQIGIPGPVETPKIQKEYKDSVEDASTSINNIETKCDDCNNYHNTDDSTVCNIQPLKQECASTANVLSNTTELQMANNDEVVIDNSLHNAYQDKKMIRFYTVRNKVIVIMEANSQFCFVGKLNIKVLYGAVSIYGNTVTKTDSFIEVYSPRGYSSVSLETSSKFIECNITDVWKVLSTEGITSDLENKLQRDINQSQPGTAIIMLTNLENTLTRFLNIYCPFKLFPRVKCSTYYSWTDPRRAEVVLQSIFYFDKTSCKQLIMDSCSITEITNKILNRWQSKEWSCTLIAGGNGVGKSTTVRYLINNLLPTTKKVVLVDVDPGQAECTPCACISYSVIEQPFMGPNFTHLNIPVYQLYIGDVSVVNCLSRYIKGVKMLIDELMKCPVLSSLPIIVNTMGFTHGIGWDIATFIIKLIRPSLTVQIMSSKSKNNFPDLLTAEAVSQKKPEWVLWSEDIIDWEKPCTHELQIVQSMAEYKCNSSTNTLNMEPYQKREVVTISYLSSIISNAISKSYNMLTPSINEIVPFVAPFSCLIISLSNPSVPPSHALTVINGNIVALCKIDLTDDSSQQIIHCSNLRVLPTAPLCPCYGFGIVRGIDIEKEEIFINTPIPASVLAHVNCLMGCIPIPSSLLLINQRGAPYVGGNRILPTSQDTRRGYFRMKHQNRQTST